MKLHIKKGDKVKILSGKNKGEEGIVQEVSTEKQRAIVEGWNMITKHTKPNAANPDGGIVKTEAPIHISNLQVIDAKGNATRVGRKLNDDGKLVRYSKKKQGRSLNNGIFTKIKRQVPLGGSLNS